MASVRVGIGGWSYAPWRGRFYPAGLKASEALHFASRCLTAIEINTTFYRTQPPDLFARWAADTPAGFVFAVKAPRAATYPKDEGAVAAAIERFVGSGIAELGSKLGPILWQFPAGRRFDPDAMERFVALLPPKLGRRRLRHAIEARHPSFDDPAWIAILQRRGIAKAIVERDKMPKADVTADFVYARLERNEAGAAEGYEADALTQWAERCRGWAAGKPVDDLPRCGGPASKVARDCFVFFISGDKERAPDSARAMISRLSNQP